MKNTKKMREKEVKISTIYNRSIKSKAELREESEAAVIAFLKRGGVIEYGKPARARRSKMSCKTSKGFVSGTAGFANGYPKRSGL